MQKVLGKQLVYKYKVNIGVETGNYQQKIFLLNVLQIQYIQVDIKKLEFHSYISYDNEQGACF